MPINNLKEYSSSSSDITGSLWFISTDKATSFDNSVDDVIGFESFTYNSNILENAIA